MDEVTPALQLVDPDTLSATELLLYQKYHPELIAPKAADGEPTEVSKGLNEMPDYLKEVIASEIEKARLKKLKESE
jgi:hypothetical protein